MIILSLKPLYSFIEWINGSEFERLIELIKWNPYFVIKWKWCFIVAKKSTFDIYASIFYPFLFYYWIK